MALFLGEAASLPDQNGATMNAEPLTKLQATRRWSPDAVERFAFEQPTRAATKTARRPDRRKTASVDRVQHVSSVGMPDSLDVVAATEQLLTPRRLRAMGRPVDPLFVYPPDGRHVFRDTTYPWRACGRVTTNAGQGSGCLVGPRHLLTASHVVGWTANDAGWLHFQPDYFDGDVLPSAWAETVYSYEKVSGGEGEYEIAEDYVVCVLGDRLGDELGWLGSKTYSDDWDGGAYWNHVGYPGDVGGGTQPARELWFSIADSWAPGFFEGGNGRDIETFTSLNHGDSGGPVFGWWDDGPYVVAVVSAQGTLDPVVTDWSSRTGNWLAGGSELPDLINQARGDHP